MNRVLLVSALNGYNMCRVVGPISLVRPKALDVDYTYRISTLTRKLSNRKGLPSASLLVMKCRVLIRRRVSRLKITRMRMYLAIVISGGNKISIVPVTLIGGEITRIYGKSHKTIKGTCYRHRTTIFLVCKTVRVRFTITLSYLEYPHSIGDPLSFIG